MKGAFVVLAALCVLAATDALRIHNSRKHAHDLNDVPAWKTFYYTQVLDHVNFNDDRTFQQRYLVNDDHWDGSGPVFFYAGNEGDVENFWNNTGFMFDIAPTFKALVVFAEHRYYGKTLPFGDDSFDLDKIVYLSVEQALADFATLIVQLQKDYKLDDKQNPIIAFGGSYGGILAAYLRYKYPNLIAGSLAASAPIYLTAGLKPSTLFFQSVTDDYTKEATECVPLIKSAFAAMQDAFDKGDYATLSQKFKLCEPISTPAGYNHLLMWMRNAFTIMSMVDYPYPASFMGPLPAWPVHHSCELLINETQSGVDILTAFNDLAGILYNDSSSCFDIYALFIECADPTSCGLGNDAKAWDYQVCTELNTVQESNGVTDMFPKLVYNPQLRQEYCAKTWNVQHIREEWTSIQYWGDKIQWATNIIFSNGLLDPWHNGGVLTNIAPSLVPVIIEDGAHHLDLRGSNPQDPASVRTARFLEVQEIQKWIEQSRAK